MHRPLRSRRKALLAGFASIGEGLASIGGGRPARYRPLSAAEAARRDRDALASDWEKVGESLAGAFARTLLAQEKR